MGEGGGEQRAGVARTENTLGICRKVEEVAPAHKENGGGGDSRRQQQLFLLSYKLIQQQQQSLRLRAYGHKQV